MDLKNIKIIKNEDLDKYIDNFNLNGVHLSENGLCLLKMKGYNKNLLEELKIKVRSCDFGSNCLMEDGVIVNEKMKGLFEEFSKYFNGNINNDYALTLEISLGVEGIVNYFIAGGNNVQELCTGIYIQNISQLDNPYFKEVIKDIDDYLYELVKKYKLENLYK